MDLSAFYFDVLKDRLYTFAPRNRGRRSAQTAVYRIASALLRLIAPTLVFTAEEVWKFCRAVTANPESVHMADFPSAEELECVGRGTGQELGPAGAGSRRSAEGARACARGENDFELRWKRASRSAASRRFARSRCENIAAFLPGLFIVSQVEVVEGKIDGGSPAAGMDGLQIKIDRAAGKKCERCWNYSTHVGESADYPTVCERCVAALAEIERTNGPSESARLMAARSSGAGTTGALIALAVGALVADQLSKFAVEKYIAPGSQRVIVPGVLNLLHTTNPGVAFGLFADSASPWQPLLLVGFSVVVIGMLVWLLITGRAGGALGQSGIALILGGAAGNVIDRFMRHQRDRLYRFLYRQLSLVYVQHGGFRDRARSGAGGA